MTPSVSNELVDYLPSLYPSNQLTISHVVQRHRDEGDVLWYYIPPVNALTVTRPLLFNVRPTDAVVSYKLVSAPGCRDSFRMLQQATQLTKCILYVQHTFCHEYGLITHKHEVCFCLTNINKAEIH